MFGEKFRFVRFVKRCKWLFVPIALFFIATSMWQSRFAMQDAWINSQPLYFVVSAILWIVAYMFSPWFMSIVLRACGSKVSYFENLDLHLSYLPARYIPGGVWHTVARVSGLHRLGVHSSHLASYVVIENLVALSVSFIIGGLLIGFYQQDMYLKLVVFSMAALGLFVLILCPFFVNRFILKMLFKVKYINYIVGIFIAIIFWMFASFSFLIHILSFYKNNSIHVCIEIIGVYLFSWGVGFIAVFAPQGVGIFEIVATNLMPEFFSFGATVSIVAGFRFVVMFADLFAWIFWRTFRSFLMPDLSSQ